MEAAVLSPAVMPELDFSSSLDAELEVRKLQELVRKLERQNQQLRSRTHGPPPSPTCGGFCLPSPVPTLLCRSSLEEPFDYFLHMGEDGAAASEEEEEEEEDGSEPSVLDELELLDLDSLSVSDEAPETWLYVSPKAKDSSDDSPSALHWCRQSLDSPRSEVEAARRSLTLRLEQGRTVDTPPTGNQFTPSQKPVHTFTETSSHLHTNQFTPSHKPVHAFTQTISRWRSSLSSPSPSTSPAPPLSCVGGVSPITSSPSSKPCSTPQSSDRHVPSLPPPLHPALHRTLSPVGRELSPLAERTPLFLPHRRSRSLRRSAFTPQSSLDSDLGGSDDDSFALGGYKLQDLTDVQVMARLQEESLRQDYASSSSAPPRRSQSFTFQLSAAPDLEEEDEEDDEDYGLLPPPQPRLARLPHSRTFSSLRDWRRSTSSLSTPPSTPPTPPYPSAGFTFQYLGPGPGQGLGPGPGQGLGPGPGQGLGPGLGMGLGLGLGGLCTTESQVFRPGSDKLRRSLPNLVRAPSMPSVPVPTAPSAPSASPCLLRSSHSFDSSSGPPRLHSSIPPPGQLHLRVQSVGNFASLSRQPLKATAYVSPTIKGSPSPQGGQCGSGSGIPMLSKAPATPTTPRSSLPRPASFIGSTSSSPRSKVGQPPRSLATPPKSLSPLGTWRDGCF
ncbi:SLAIN motif-containing protein 1-like [Antennarius striatus]|uniref:SLAIN motif-containing protein 1-like n=1 Tax=Antennarius striatus TaxID=241820 RepID=UPI0035B0F46D